MQSNSSAALRLGAGLGIFAIGLALAVAPPPPWWPDMPPFLVHMSVAVGAGLMAWSGTLLFIYWCEKNDNSHLTHRVLYIWRWITKRPNPLICFLVSVILVLAVPPLWSILSPEVGRGFYIAFAFPNPQDAMGVTLAVNYKFINNESNPVSLEDVSMLQISATNEDKEFQTLDGCNVPELSAYAKFFEPSIPNNLIAFGRYTQAIATITKPSSVVANKASVEFPSLIPTNAPHLFSISFPVRGDNPDVGGRLKATLWCPMLTFMNTRGQESTYVCQGIAVVAGVSPGEQPQIFRRYYGRYNNLYGGLGLFWRKAQWFQLAPVANNGACLLVSE